MSPNSGAVGGEKIAIIGHPAHPSETLLKVLDRLQAAYPELPLYTFVGGRDKAATKLSARELWVRSRALASMLLAHAPPGARALLVFPTGPEFFFAFFACLAAKIIPIPLAPPRRNRARERFEAALTSGEPQLLLTTSGQRDALASELRGATIRRFVAVDELDLSEPPTDGLPTISASDVALIQCTSGSTSSGRGVAVTHANLIANEEMLRRNLLIGPEDRYVTWLPMFHDMGLIGAALLALYAGCPLTLMPPAAFVRDPLYWLEVISETRATVSGAPNFAFELIARMIENRSPPLSVDLSCLRLLYNASEPVQLSTLERFARVLEPFGLPRESITPCYGLAEATLLVSGGPTGRGWRSTKYEGREVVSCGRISEGSRVEIVDPVTLLPCAPGEVGEIWVYGPHVARGYWNDPEGTRNAFGAAVRGGEGAFLRTGDLGFISDGELYVTGRLKDLIIVRGVNHYPHEIEATVLEHLSADYVGRVAAIALATEAGTEGVALAIELPREQRMRAAMLLESVRPTVAAAIAADHEIPLVALYLLDTGTMPKTTSGKLRRGTLSRALADGTLIPRAKWERTNNGEEFSPSMGLANRTDHGDPSKVIEKKLGWLRQYAARRFDRLVAEERRQVPPHIILDFGEQGLFGVIAPTECGGLGLDAQSAMRIFQQVAAIDTGLALLIGIHNTLGLRPIMYGASDVVRSNWLTRLAAGRQLAALAVSEDAAGSNPRAIETRAVKHGDHWVLDGEKRWVGLGAWAGLMTVVARGYDSDGRYLGPVALAVPSETPGVSIGSESPTFGARSIVQSRVRFVGVRLPDTARVGRIGDGLNVAQDAFAFGRMGIAALCAGAMKRAAALAYRYASRRQIASGLLLDHGITRVRLQAIVDDIELIEALAKNTALAYDQSALGAFAILSLVCKIVAPELAYRSVDLAMQMLGGRGYEETSSVPQLLRDIRLTRIFEGPTETLCTHLGALRSRKPSELKPVETFLKLTGFAVHKDNEPNAFGSHSLPHEQLRDARIGEQTAIEIALACATVHGLPSDVLDRLRSRHIQARDISSIDGLSDDSRIASWAKALGSDSASLGLETATDELIELEGRNQILLRSEETPNLNGDPQQLITPRSQTLTQLEEILRSCLAREGRTVSSIEPHASLVSLGLDSLLLVTFATAIEEQLGVELEPSVLFEYDSLEKLAGLLERST